MTDPHPIREFRNDKNATKKMDAFKKYTKDFIKYDQNKDGGAQLLEMPFDINLELAKSFQDLQGLIYKRELAMSFILYFQQYWEKSRQMFSFDPLLAESLDQTEVGDIPWSEVRLPHDNFHISWGDFGQPAFSTMPGYEYVVDGAYVQKISDLSPFMPKDSILIKFTAQLIHPTYSEARKERSAQGFIFSDPIYDYALSGEGALTVGNAIEAGEDSYYEYCVKRDDELLRSAISIGSEIGVPPNSSGINPFTEKFERGIDIFRDYIPLLFNSIFYLVQRPSNCKEHFSKSAPKGQVRRLSETTDESSKKSLIESLARKGYSTITFVRDPDIVDRFSKEKNDRSIRAHWRRGHWRHQAFGKNLSQKKWIWIKPVLVKKNEEFTIGSKHIVKPQE